VSLIVLCCVHLITLTVSLTFYLLCTSFYSKTMSFLNTQLDLYNQGHTNKFMSCFGFCRTNGNGGSSQRLLIQNSLSELKVNVQTYEKSLEKAGVSLAAATNPDTNSQYIPVKRSRRNSLVGAARQSLNIKKKAQVIDKALVEELLRNKTAGRKYCCGSKFC